MTDDYVPGGGISHLGRDLDGFILDRIERAQLPGLAAAVTQGGQLLWAHGYGHARFTPVVRVQPTTVFKVASLSKPITAAAILTLVDSGSLDLDADINSYLPFEVKHPADTKKPVTVRMLLSHVSGLRDNDDVLEPLYTIDWAHAPLGDFLKDYLTKDGRYYDTKFNFAEFAPGDDFEFSGIGFSLAALVAESITGEPFHAFTRRAVFEPLRMKTAIWHVDNPNDAHVALPYHPVRIGKSFETYGAYTLPHYPDSGLTVSAPDLARFMDVIAGERRCKKVMKPETAKLMREEAHPGIAPSVGLGCYWEEHNDLKMIGHAGADHGISARMFWYPAEDIGIVLLANGEPTTKAKWALTAIESHLYQAVPDIVATRVAAEAAGEAEREVESRVIPFRRHAS